MKTTYDVKMLVEELNRLGFNGQVAVDYLGCSVKRYYQLFARVTPPPATKSEFLKLSTKLAELTRQVRS